MTAFADHDPWTSALFVPFVVPPGFNPSELLQLLRAAPLPDRPPADGDPGDSCDCTNCR